MVTFVFLLTYLVFLSLLTFINSIFFQQTIFESLYPLLIVERGTGRFIVVFGWIIGLLVSVGIDLRLKFRKAASKMG